MRSRSRVMVFLVAIVSILVGGPAEAFRINTSSTGANLHWPSFPVTYRPNSRGASGLPGSLPAVREAFRTWASVPGTRNQFTEGEPTAEIRGRRDGMHLVIWQTGTLDPDKFDDRTIAVTTTWFRVFSGEITEADIEFNGRDMPWGTNGAADRIDAETVALHEIGHLIGLGHTSDRSTVMFPRLARGEIKRSLSPDEIAAVQFLYPASSPPLTATASASPRRGPAPLPVAFAASVAGGTAPYDFAWAFGDGQTSSLRNPAHTYGLPGTSNAAVTVTDASGRTTAGAVTVTADATTAGPTPPPGPPATLAVSPASVVGPGDRVTLTISGRPGQVAILAHSTQNAGARVRGRELRLGPDFRIAGTGPVGALGVFALELTVPPGTPPRTHYFQGALTTDAQTLTDLTLTNGASLVVTGPAPPPVAPGGCTLTPIGPGAISGTLADDDCAAPHRPASKADLYTFGGTAGQVMTISMRSVQFDTYLILVGPDGMEVAANDDSDGTLNSRITLSLPVTGPYVIEATAFAGFDRGSYTLSLTEGAPPRPTVPLSVHAADNAGSGGQAPFTVEFTATASGGVPPYPYLWEFGDGESSPSPGVAHTYTRPGSYTSRLTVTDSEEQSARLVRQSPISVR